MSRDSRGTPSIADRPFVPATGFGLLLVLAGDIAAAVLLPSRRNQQTVLQAAA